MKYFVFAVLVFVGLIPNAKACIQIPEDLTLTGASFSEHLSLGVGSNCGFSLGVSSKRENAIVKDRSDKWNQEFTKWKEQNSESETDTEESKRAELDGKYGKYGDIAREVDFTLVNSEGKICVSSRMKNVCAKSDKNCRDFKDIKNCSNQTMVVKDSGKPVAIVKKTGEGTFVLSVDSKGKEDPTKPFLKIVTFGKSGANIEAIENGSIIGKAEIKAEACSRSMGSPRGGQLDLRGKLYQTEGAGCKGSLVGTEYKQANKLLLNGQPAQATDD